jgi:hypothetical protein
MTSKYPGVNQVNIQKEPNLTSREHRSNPQVNANINIILSAKVNHKDHNTTQHIPTIVSGEVSASTNNRVKKLNANNEGSVQNLMSELKMESTNKCNSYSANKKYKIICIGDSHTRGFTKILKNLVGDNFELYSVVKPGSNSNQLLVTATQEVKKLNYDDILVICIGTNDLATNKSTLAFENISNMVKRNNHTNIILIDIHHRYDTSNTNTTNGNIEKLIEN